MKKLLIILALATTAQAEIVVTNKGTSVVTQSGSTTWVTGTAGPIAVTPSVNSVTGIGTVITPQGTFLVSKQGSTTTVIQTSKGK